MKKNKLLRWAIILGLASIFIAASGYGARKGYRAWRQDRLVRQGKEFLAQGEQRKAQLSLSRALAINSRDLEAIRLMASMAESGRSPAALVWRQRAVEVSPDSPDDQLALAQTAASLREFAVATNSLRGIPASAQNTARFHNVSGGVAALMGDHRSAETHFAEAVRLDPNDTIMQLNLAVVRLQNTNPPVLQAARSGLESLAGSSTNHALRTRAKRELVGFALRQGDTNGAVRLSEDLIKDPGARFSDRLLYLDTLGRTRNPIFPEALQAARRDAVTNANTVGELLLWELTKVPAPRTLEWVDSLPPEVTTNAAVALAASDLRVAANDWKGLATSLEGQFWGELEFLRHGYRTLALRAQNLTAAADAEWGQALKGAGASKTTMSLLLRAVTQWRWPNEMREVLSMIVSRYPNDTMASDLLIQNLHSEGQSRPLLALFRQLAAARPTDLQVRNNLAMTAMLLEAIELKPHDLAREVYQASPTNSNYASTYAFSLYLQQKNNEALELMNKLPKDYLEDPAVAGYYGIILQSAGDTSKARTYLDISSKARLLPEEKRLFDRARSGG